MSAVEPLAAALGLAARLMLPLVLGLGVAVAIAGLARRLVGDDPALHAAARLLGVGAALAITGGAIADAIVEFARWSWGGG
ncbi:MAG: hypothetical protein H6701_03315 [Myxococcales bacterium]|nr:hypothetical protein [Myxococcales bacterium]MCB9550496.1 hypothetical protein [Myxococcales bacterium]